MTSSEKGKTVTLHDAGGLIIGVILLGVPFGTLFDYLWNFVVLSVVLPRVGGSGYRAGCGARGEGPVLCVRHFPRHRNRFGVL
jgi:hypothetical protein